MSTPKETQTQILSHAIMVGLTPLIPIPILDDVVKGYLMRRMVRSLAANRGLKLADGDVEALTDEPSSGCSLGCIGSILFYPIKKIFRKIFYVLEIKRAVDLTSSAYHRGLLLDHALDCGALAGSNLRPSADIRKAVDEVLARTATKPVEHAIRLTYRHSTSALKNGASILTNAIQSAPKSGGEAQVKAAVESVKEEEEKQLGGLRDELSRRLESLPRDYFDQLYADLRSKLGIS